MGRCVATDRKGPVESGRIHFVLSTAERSSVTSASDPLMVVSTNLKNGAGKAEGSL